MEIIFLLYLKNIHKDSPERAKLARTNVEPYALLKEFLLLSTFLFDRVIECNIFVMKTANLSYQNRSSSKDIMVDFDEINTKL